MGLASLFAVPTQAVRSIFLLHIALEPAGGFAESLNQGSVPRFIDL